jgi:hypothetical protein
VRRLSVCTLTPAILRLVCARVSRQWQLGSIRFLIICPLVGSRCDATHNWRAILLRLRTRLLRMNTAASMVRSKGAWEGYSPLGTYVATSTYDMTSGYLPVDALKARPTYGNTIVRQATYYVGIVQDTTAGRAVRIWHTRPEAVGVLTASLHSGYVQTGCDMGIRGTRIFLSLRDL